MAINEILPYMDAIAPFKNTVFEQRRECGCKDCLHMSYSAPDFRREEDLRQAHLEYVGVLD